MPRTATQPKVLVLDDDPAIVTCIGHVLRRRGCSPLPATGWTEAIDLVRSEKPDLLLLDLSMPTIEGETFLRFLRTNGCQVPAIVVSGSVTNDVRASLEPLDVSAFVSKPFHIEDLERAVDEALKRGAEPWPPEAEPSQPDGLPTEALQSAVLQQETPGPNTNCVSPEDVLFYCMDPSDLLGFVGEGDTDDTQSHRAGRGLALTYAGRARQPRSRISPGVRKRTMRQLYLLSVGCVVIAALLGLFNLFYANLSISGIVDGVQKSLKDTREQADRTSSH